MPPTPTALNVRTVTGIALVPTLIALELFGGMIQGWIFPLLGAIGDEYDVPGGGVSWILTVGLLSSAVSVPLMTTLADRHGPRRMLVIAASLTAAGSVLIAVAPTFTILLIGSIVQGPVAALLPIEMSLLKRHRPTDANRIVGFLVGTLTFGVAVGSLLGGLTMDAVNSLMVTQLIGAAPLVVLALVLGFTVPRTSGDTTRTVDWAGAGLFGLSLIGVMYGLSAGSSAGWASPTTLGSLLFGVAAFTVLLFVESRAATPLLDVKLLRRARLGVPLTLGLLVALPLFGAQTPTVLFLSADPAVAGYGTAASTGVIGVILAVIAVFATIGSFLAPVLVRILQPEGTVALACLLAAAGSLLLTTGPTQLLVAAALMALSWLGCGIAMAVLPGVVIDRAPASSSASVAGLYNTGRTIAGSFAGAFVAAVMTVLQRTSTPAAETVPFAAFQVIWSVFGAVSVAAAILALTLAGRRRTQIGKAS